MQRHRLDRAFPRCQLRVASLVVKSDSEMRFTILTRDQCISLKVVVFLFPARQKNVCFVQQEDAVPEVSQSKDFREA